MDFDWDPAKNEWLIATRGVSFDQVVATIGTADDLGVIPNMARPGQLLFIVRIKEYTYACPAVPTKTGFFLKTIYPSRKLHTRFGGQQ